MFPTPVDTRFAIIDRLAAFDGRALAFPADRDLCRERAPATPDDDDALRFAAAARRSASPFAFRPVFSAADWRAFASFCTAHRLAEGTRVGVAGGADRTLRLVVDGSLWTSAAGAGGPAALPPGSVLGEDALFAAASGNPDVRALEDSLVLELSLPRHKELTAARPAIAFELLRAAGAVIAARGRRVAA